MKDEAKAAITAAWIVGILGCVGVIIAAVVAWALPYIEKRSSQAQATPIVVLQTIIPPTYTPYPTYTPQSKSIAQPTYTPYPTYTPVPNPWLKLIAPADGAIFAGSNRTAVTLSWDWLPGAGNVDSFDVLMKPENGDWFILWGGAVPNQRNSTANYQELSGVFFWKVTARVGSTTHTSEVRKIQFKP